VTDSGQDGPRDQHNYGSGTFIGRDNYAPIRYELLDPRTKSTLAKLSRAAPELSEILKRALTEGVISPDAVVALQRAVQNINMDVAEALLVAGRNINQDVADALMIAGHNINDQVAERFDQVRTGLKDTAGDLEQILQSLQEIAKQITSMQDGVDPGWRAAPPGAVTRVPYTVQVDTRPASGRWDYFWFRSKLVLWGFAAGLAAGSIFVYWLIKH
jgi:hypothetical protein